jgi:hypothetical protein
LDLSRDWLLICPYACEAGEQWRKRSNFLGHARWHYKLAKHGFISKAKHFTHNQQGRSAHSRRMSQFVNGCAVNLLLGSTGSRDYGAGSVSIQAGGLQPRGKLAIVAAGHVDHKG